MLASIPVSRDLAARVLQIEADAIRDLVPRLGEAFDRAVAVLLAGPGRLVATGVGKSGFVAQKVSATLASTGTPSLFLHPTEAIHGDLGRIVAGDVVLAVSYSGETEELLALLPSLKRLGCPLVSLTGGPRSTLAQAADVHLDVSVRQEACPLGLAPTASTAAAMAMGDALAMAVAEKRGFTEDDFAVRHPGGRLGRRLLRVEDVMRTGDRVPRVTRATPMKDVLFEMTAKRLGMTTVVEADGRLAGVISDGDLRRHMARLGYGLLDQPAGECMTGSPVLIARRELATAALNLMEARRITSLVVVAPDGTVDGVVHLHDLWKTEMI